MTALPIFDLLILERGGIMDIYGCAYGADVYNRTEKGVGIGLGNFDGIHMGHQALMEELKKQSALRGIPSVIYTFANHPNNVLFPEKPTKLIVTNTQKASIMKKIGVDGVYFEHFDTKYGAMSAEQFVRDILVDRLNAKVVVVGHNYSFAKKGEGTPEVLKELGKRYGFDTVVIPPVTVGDTTVSSTLLRGLIKDGAIDKYPEYTGRRYSIPGVVQQGRQVGNQLGFPTANILPREGFALPDCGVYITETLIGGVLYGGITNIGNNPTFNLNMTTVETHLFDYSDVLYGQTIEVFFIKRMRGEIKFASAKELVQRVNSDIVEAQNYFKDKGKVGY